MDALPRMETLDRHRCVELLAGAGIGRLAFELAPPRPAGSLAEPRGHDDRPDERQAPGVVPLSYLLDGPEGDESLVFRTTYGSRLGRSAVGSPVSFEVDELRPSAQEGWSVVVSGHAEQITDQAELERLGRRLQPWAPGFKELFLRLPLEQVSGRRLVAQHRVIELPDSPAPRWSTPEGWEPPTRRSAVYRTDFDGH